MTPAELKASLERHGIRPLRDRGQHFLLDESVPPAMAEAAGVKEGDRVVEIGPGPGILTGTLLDAGAEVVAVELDRKLCALLTERFGQRPNFRLLQGDTLSFSNADLAARFAPPPLRPSASPYKVIANLPYNITSAILEKFLLEPPLPASMTIMVQREVADRILAGPGDMSSLAVLVQTLARPSRVRNVPAGVFFPPPKVDSAVIHIALKTDAEKESFFRGADPDRYFTLVRQAFSAKRKQLKNSLRVSGVEAENLEKAFNKAKIPSSKRPEELSVEQWASLVGFLRE